MTTCADCGRDRPESDKFCRYCGVEVNKPEAKPRGIRASVIVGAVALLVATGIWLQFRPTPMRPSEVSGQRQNSPAVSLGPPLTSEQESAFAHTESLLNAQTGNLVVIGPEKTEAVVLSGTAPRRWIALPPATHWEITDDGLVGFTDEVLANVMRFSADKFTETKAQDLYTDLNGELIHIWNDGDRMRVLPVFDDANASGGDFSASAPIVRKQEQEQAERTIGPLLTTYQGDTYGWNGDGEWERVATGSPSFASDPIVITECDRPYEPDATCSIRLIDLRSGEERELSPVPGTSVDAFLSNESVVGSPDLAYVYSVADQTLIDLSKKSASGLSLRTWSWDGAASWSLDSSMLGIDGDSLRIFDTSGTILADVIPSEGGRVTARFVPDDASGTDQ